MNHCERRVERNFRRAPFKVKPAIWAGVLYNYKNVVPKVDYALAWYPLQPLAILCVLSRYSESVAIEEIEISRDLQQVPGVSPCARRRPSDTFGTIQCSYICYHLAPDTTTSHNVSTSRNVSDVLMEHSRQSVLPARPTNPIIRADQQVRNELLNLLAKMSVGWSPSVVQSIGDRFIRILSAYVQI